MFEHTSPLALTWHCQHSFGGQEEKLPHKMGVLAFLFLPTKSVLVMPTERYDGHVRYNTRFTACMSGVHRSPLHAFHACVFVKLAALRTRI